MREEGEFSGGIFTESNNHVDSDDVYINVVNDGVDKLCTICGKGDLMESDNGLSRNDEHDVGTTIEFEWIVCEICRQPHYKSC